MLLSPQPDTKYFPSFAAQNISDITKSKGATSAAPAGPKCKLVAGRVGSLRLIIIRAAPTDRQIFRRSNYAGYLLTVQSFLCTTVCVETVCPGPFLFTFRNAECVSSRLSESTCLINNSLYREKIKKIDWKIGLDFLVCCLDQLCARATAMVVEHNQTSKKNPIWHSWKLVI